MKRIVSLIIFVLIIGITACSNLGVQQSAYQSFGCDKYSGVCVTIKAEKEFIDFGEVLPVIVTVTSEQDFSKLGLSVAVGSSQRNQGQSFFPEQVLTYNEQNMIAWQFDVNKDQAITFRGTILFNNIEADLISVKVVVGNGTELRVTNYLEVFFTDTGGQVFYSGTQIPITPELIIEETVIGYTYTPGPFPTWAASATWYPEIATKEAKTQQAARTPEPVQTQKP